MGIYMIYVLTPPSILILPSCNSLLYIHARPLVQIVFKMSGFESGTIMSPSAKMISFFSAMILSRGGFYMIKIANLGYQFVNIGGFDVNRPHGSGDFLFLFFHCIIYSLTYQSLINNQ